MTLHPQAQVHAAWAATFDAVASQLAKSARSDGGTLLATAADLHKLGTGEAWPRSALELERVTQPELARRPDAAVKPVADPVARALAAAPTPTPVTALTDAEYERVQAEAQAVITHAIEARHAAAADLHRAAQHRRNLKLIATKAPTP